MSSEGGHTPGDRSGTGKALIDALKAKKQRPMEERAAAAAPSTVRAGN